MANIIETYSEALKRKDLSGLPYAEGFLFDGILQKAEGAEQFAKVCQQFFGMVQEIRIEACYGDDSGGAVVYEFDCPVGTIKIVDHVETEGGKIKKFTPYFDPTPLAPLVSQG